LPSMKDRSIDIVGYHPHAFGAKGDGAVYSGLTTNSASTLITGSASTFPLSAANKKIMVYDALSGGRDIGVRTVISVALDGSSVTLDSPPDVTAAQAAAIVCTDDTTVLQAMF